MFDTIGLIFLEYCLYHTHSFTCYIKFNYFILILKTLQLGLHSLPSPYFLYSLKMVSYGSIEFLEHL